MPGIGILVFRVAILSLKITAVVDVHSWSIVIRGHNSGVQGQKAAIQGLNPQICNWTQGVHGQSVDICD